MLLETLLKKVYRFTQESPGHEGVAYLHRCAGLLAKPVEEMILGLDARSIGDLRKTVPEAFPRKLRKGPLVASQNIHGTWRVDVQPDNIQGIQSNLTVLDEGKKHAGI